MCLWIAPYTRIWKRARFGCESKGFEVLEVPGVFEDLGLPRVKVLGVCSVALIEDLAKLVSRTTSDQRERMQTLSVHPLRKENQILVNNAVISFYSQKSLTSADNL